MRKLMWFAIGFAAACGLCVYLLPDSWILPLILVCGILLMCTCVIGMEMKSVRVASMAVLGCTVGLVWFLGFQRFYLLPAMTLDGNTVETTVTASDYSYETTYGTAVDGTMELEGKTYQIRIYINEKTELEPGDTVTGVFRFRVTVPGGREEGTYHAGKGIFLLGYQSGEVAVFRAVQSEGRYYAAFLREKIRGILWKCFPEDIVPFVQALLIGDGTELNYETDTAFKISGIRHIIAVSGLHVSILFSLISTITFRRRFLTALISFPTLFLFAAVAGFTPSVTRACIMVSLMILAQLINKEYDSTTALAFACLVMLLANPLVITSVSFQLSAGCVAGILMFNPPISGWLTERLGETKGNGIKAKGKRWFVSSISVTLSAMSLTTPLSASYFGAVSLIGVVTNLVTLWVVNFIFNGIFAVCVLSMLSIKAATVLGWIVALPAYFVLWISKLLASVPLAAVYTKSVYIVAWLVFVYVLLALFLLMKNRRPGVMTGCAVIGLCLALLASWLGPLTDNSRMTVLDVGQGQSILLQSQGRTYLVDCGGDNDEMTADLVAETLLSQGISRLDGIILTHCDRDHAGGAGYLLSRVQCDLLLIPSNADVETAAALEEAAGGEVVYVSQDLLLTWGTTEMTVFGPTFAGDGNENSLCVLFEAENCDILITGDRSGFGERLLLRSAELPQVDVLIAGHHGSKNSTCEELLQAVQPDTVIISVGEDNRYGHPAPELLQRLEEFGCTVYRTDQNGTIIFGR